MIINIINTIHNIYYIFYFLNGIFSYIYFYLNLYKSKINYSISNIDGLFDKLYQYILSIFFSNKCIALGFNDK